MISDLFQNQFTALFQVLSLPHVFLSEYQSFPDQTGDSTISNLRTLIPVSQLQKVINAASTTRICIHRCQAGCIYLKRD